MSTGKRLFPNRTTTGKRLSYINLAVAMTIKEKTVNTLDLKAIHLPQLSCTIQRYRMVITTHVAQNTAIFFSNTLFAVKVVSFYKYYPMIPYTLPFKLSKFPTDNPENNAKLFFAYSEDIIYFRGQPYNIVFEKKGWYWQGRRHLLYYMPSCCSVGLRIPVTWKKGAYGVVVTNWQIGVIYCYWII